MAVESVAVISDKLTGGQTGKPVVDFNNCNKFFDTENRCAFGGASTPAPNPYRVGSHSAVQPIGTSGNYPQESLQKPNSACRGRHSRGNLKNISATEAGLEFDEIKERQSEVTVGVRNVQSSFQGGSGDGDCLKVGCDQIFVADFFPKKIEEEHIHVYSDFYIPFASTATHESATVSYNSKKSRRKRKSKHGKRNCSRENLIDKNSNSCKMADTKTSCTCPMNHPVTVFPFQDTALSANCKAIRLYKHHKEKLKENLSQRSYLVLQAYGSTPENSKILKPSKCLSCAYTPSGSLYRGTAGNPPSKNRSAVHYPHSVLPQQQNQCIQRNLLQVAEMPKKTSNFYLSERHSQNVIECGRTVSGAPSVTPVPEHLKNNEYKSSLSGVQARRAVQEKLRVVEKKAQAKTAQLQDNSTKKERQKFKENEVAVKQLQRQQIYALNKIMTDLENERFFAFCKKNNILNFALHD